MEELGRTFALEGESTCSEKVICYSKDNLCEWSFRSSFQKEVLGQNKEFNTFQIYSSCASTVD